MVPKGHQGEMPPSRRPVSPGRHDSAFPCLGEFSSGAIPAYAFPTAVFAGGHYGEPSTVGVALITESNEGNKQNPLSTELSNPQISSPEDDTVDSQAKPQTRIRALLTRVRAGQDSLLGVLREDSTCRNFFPYLANLRENTGMIMKGGGEKESQSRLTQSRKSHSILASRGAENNVNNIARNINVKSTGSNTETKKMGQQSNIFNRNAGAQTNLLVPHMVTSSSTRNHGGPRHCSGHCDMHQWPSNRRPRSRSIAIKCNRYTTGDNWDGTPACSSSERMYDWATWRMYNRIIDYRRRRPLRHTAYVSQDIAAANAVSQLPNPCEDNNLAYYQGYISPLYHPDLLFDGEVFELEI